MGIEFYKEQQDKGSQTFKGMFCSPVAEHLCIRVSTCVLVPLSEDMVVAESRQVSSANKRLALKKE